MRKEERLGPAVMFAAGLLLGAAARLFDAYGQTLGEIFSQMAVWILLGTLIARGSATARAAMRNVFLFCVGMLLAYYAAAMIAHGVYGWSFIIGWTGLALVSPVLAYLAWWTKQRGVVPRLIGVGIVLVSVLSSVVLFDRLRIYDLVIDGLLVYVLFFRGSGRRARG